ncbi:MAG: DUF2062 domain-containing protein [Cardiobacteriaceae bacterium]|nr:DUF2062 domain-containing protein [Cardiobacteriaceae bacterium]
MPKYFFKRILPSYDLLVKSRILRPMLVRFAYAGIWQVNRRAISLAVAIGLFFGTLPMPLQTVAAGAVAIMCRANLPAAAMMTWWSNPITMAPALYLNYRVGSWLYEKVLGQPEQIMRPEQFDIQSLKTLSGQILLPLFGGSVIVGIFLGLLGYIIVLLWWRFSLIRRHLRRKNRYGKTS